MRNSNAAPSAALLSVKVQFLTGVTQSLPIAVSVALYGALFGTLAVQAGMSPLEVGLMSGLVFSGAAQFVAIELWSTPVSVSVVAVASLLVGLRFTLMSASFEPALRSITPGRAYFALFFMSDENWALSLRRVEEGRFSIAFYAGVCGSLYVCWISTTVAGAVLGGLVTDPARYGFDVVFTAVFIVLIVGLWRGPRNGVPWVVSAIAAVVCHRFVPGNWYIFVGGVAGILVAVVTWTPERPASDEG